VKSREQNFYYGHPQNRFWKVIAALFEEPVPERIPEKKDLLLKHHIALWDVIAECDIAGSSDSSIKNVVPAELSVILDHAPIRTIYANGAKAYDLYQKYTYPVTGMDISKKMSRTDTQALRTQMQMIFQDPMASLNPRKKVGDIIGEGLDIHHMYHTHEEREQKIKSILAKVGLAPEHHLHRLPYQVITL
jgi:hypoxanthine-DNA glycosylase